MNRIEQLFNDRQQDVLSVYFPAAFPQLNDTLPILSALQSGGVDMVEIGIPFSDPMADGPTIQQASSQALRNGISLRLIFDQLQTMRLSVSIPVVLMGYLNPIMQYGFEAFCQSCSEVGVDGVIIPDLPFADYMADYKAVADRYNVKVVMLITPETSDERIRLIDQNTNGFIYMVSSASTTGVRQSFDSMAEAYFDRISRMGLRNPRLIGFGVSNADTFSTACRYASGAIVGSRFVQLLTECQEPKEAVRQLVNEVGR